MILEQLPVRLAITHVILALIATLAVPAILHSSAPCPTPHVSAYQVTTISSAFRPVAPVMSPAKHALGSMPTTVLLVMLQMEDRSRVTRLVFA